MFPAVGKVLRQRAHPSSMVFRRPLTGLHLPTVIGMGSPMDNERVRYFRYVIQTRIWMPLFVSCASAATMQ